MAAGAVRREQNATALDGVGAEAAIQFAHEVSLLERRLRVALAQRLLARHAQVGRVRLRGLQEVDDVGQPILDGAEVRTIAAALADVERRLAEVAHRRIELAQVGQVVEPALLRTRTDIEVDALHGLVGADRVFAALQDVMNGLRLERTLPALVLATRFAPAGLASALPASPAGHDSALRHFTTCSLSNCRPHARVDDRVHRAGVVDLVARDRRRVGRARDACTRTSALRACCRACRTSGSPRRACTGCRPRP